MNGYVIAQSRAKSFYPIFERKAELPEVTHYCPGCGHGILHKLIARAIDELGVQDRTILVTPVGCSVFAYYYFDTGNIQAAHGRAAAVASAAKRTQPGSIVISYQGDGDLAAIGIAEIIHAANRGEPITVFFVNNAIYGMTGGQVAPTTPLNAPSTTTPFGRTAMNEGYPLRMSELIATLEAPVYVERVALGNNKQIIAAGRAVKRALDVQVKGLGFSFVEVLSPCPTVWKMNPLDAQKRVRDDLAKVFPLGVCRDRIKDTQPRPAPMQPLPPEAVAQLLQGTAHHAAPANHTATANRAATARERSPIDLRIKIAGFGGQGVLLLGEVLAEAGMRSGLDVSWLPSYGPEMRSGTSNCSVRICSQPVDSPVISHPNVLIAFNEPSLRKFWSTVRSGGTVYFNGESLPKDLSRPDIDVVAMPFAEFADRLGDTRVTNMVVLGMLLERNLAIPRESVEATLRHHVNSEKLLDLDLKAVERGCQLAMERSPS